MLTLDEALTEVARRSFYEDAIVIPVIRVDAPDAPIGYIVEDSIGDDLADEWTWSYDNGLSGRNRASETSRLHDPAETYTDAKHVRYNLPESVSALEDGKSVTFAYAVVTDDDVTYTDDGAVDSDGAPTDDLAGWILASIIWEDAS